MQTYVHGDALVEGGRWWCEHELDDDAPPVAVEDLHRQLDDPGDTSTVTCPDCGTGWVCWTHGGHRLAKPVVVRIG